RQRWPVVAFPGGRGPNRVLGTAAAPSAGDIQRLGPRRSPIRVPQLRWRQTQLVQYSRRFWRDILRSTSAQGCRRHLGVHWLARPGSPWIELFKSVTDTQSARDVVVNLHATYFPEDAALIEQLQPLHEDRHSWFLGAVTPTARRAVATTANGYAVVAIGDAAS